MDINDDFNWDDFDFESNNGFEPYDWYSNSTYDYNQWMKDKQSPEVSKDFTYKAYNNTYKVLIGEKTIGKIMNEGGDTIPFIFDAEKYKSKDNIFFDKNNLIDSVIEYFCELEEYEKCAKLLKAKR